MKLLEVADIATLVEKAYDLTLWGDAVYDLNESVINSSGQFLEGQRAYSEGKTLKECPYRPWSLYETIWIMGYQSRVIEEDYSAEETCDGDEFYLRHGWVEESEEIEEAEYQGRTVQLNKPMKGDVRKFKVYVKDPKTGNVKKVNFGDPNMRIKKSDPKRRKSFVARHRCKTAKDKTTARYWSCRGATSRVGGMW